MTVLEQLPERARVCLIRLRSLGDCVLTTPAIQLLKEFRPDLEVSVAVEPPFRTVFEDHPLVAAAVDASWQAVRRFRPQLCINLHGGTRSQWMTALSGARFRAGFAHHSVTVAYNLRIPRAQGILGVNRTVHTAEHLASAMFALGVPVQDVPRASLTASESDALVPESRFAVLHPFASAADKQWPAARFCEVARYLKLWGVEPIFLAGPNDDVAPFASHRLFRHSLGDAKALVSRATVFIGNDSGPAHLAAAFGIPSVVIFGNSNPAIWCPWRTECEVVLSPDGIEGVNVSRVIAALERLRTLEEAHA